MGRRRIIPTSRKGLTVHLDQELFGILVHCEIRDDLGEKDQ